jgi:diacylglycerol O-acyltransferase / trehalose O-mycolyltransferase
MLTAVLKAAVCAALAVGAAPGAAPGAGPSTTPSATATADDGASIVSSSRIDPRMLDLQVKSPAVGSTVSVRLLLPSDWSADGPRTWPVLYLLQGAHDDDTSWTRETDIESFTADRGVIVVMPSSGPTGLVTRWWNAGKNSPDYETFQVTELMQLLQRDFHAGDARAVAGVSTGGYSAMIMAAHHPGEFTAAASYSGILDTAHAGMSAVLSAIVAREHLAPDALWGGLQDDAGLWDADNPYAQAARLRSTALFVSSGSGSGLAAKDGDDPLGQALEGSLWPQAGAFADRLRLLGIPVQTDLYSGGVHAWSSWQGEFTRSWPMLAASLGLSS